MQARRVPQRRGEQGEDTWVHYRDQTESVPELAKGCRHHHHHPLKCPGDACNSHLKDGDRHQSISADPDPAGFINSDPDPDVLKIWIRIQANKILQNKLMKSFLKL